MNIAVAKALIDRPGWIPAEILSDWDPGPYAYQTEEERMPAGGLHGQLLAYIMEVLRHFLEKRELMLLQDIFMLYRDAQGIKQRVGPDLLLMPYRAPPPSAYDLDREPPPAWVTEITSPDSQVRDLEDKKAFYEHLGIDSYLIIDAVTPRDQLRERMELHLWQRGPSGHLEKTAPDAAGWLTLPAAGIAFKAWGRRLHFKDAVTGKALVDNGRSTQEWEAAAQRAEAEKQRADAEQQRAEVEKQRADAAQQRAEAEKQRADQFQEQIAQMQAEIARLKAAIH